MHPSMCVSKKKSREVQVFINGREGVQSLDLSGDTLVLSKEANKQDSYCVQNNKGTSILQIINHHQELLAPLYIQ